jgi:hypothetical protein
MAVSLFSAFDGCTFNPGNAGRAATFCDAGLPEGCGV